MARSILVTGARAPAAVHFARLLTTAGHKVILADSQRFALGRATRFKHAYVQLPKPVDGIQAYGAAVENILQKYGCDLIVPTCEEIFHLAAWRDLYRRPIPLLAPNFDTLSMVHNKHTFAVSTQGYEAAAAATYLLESQADVARLASQAKLLVFKPVWSRFANRVFICRSYSALSNLIPTKQEPWIAQDYLPGEELCCWAFMQGGKLLALSVYRPLYRVGHGAAIAFEGVEDGNIRSFVESYGQKLNWHGQISFDFRRDAAGQLHVLECNPRATSGVHFFDATSGLATTIADGKPALPTSNVPMTLPLAMAVFGLSAAYKNGGLAGVRRWYKACSNMRSIAAWNGDRSLLPIQLLSLCEIGVRALKGQMGVTAASTADIEWNGIPLK